MIKVEDVSHVGIVVPDLEVASAYFAEHLGCEVGDPIDVEEQSLRIAYIEFAHMKIELLSPTDEDSPISKFLERNPSGGLHHLALSVPDAEVAARNCTLSGIRVLGDGPRAGHHGRPLFFLHPKDTLGALIEIEQRPSPTEKTGR